MSDSRHPAPSCSLFAVGAHALRFIAWLLVHLALLPFRFVATFPNCSLSVAVGEAGAALAAHLGPAYVKVAQVVSTRLHQIPTSFSVKLAQLQDDVPGARKPLRLDFLRTELGDLAVERFKSIDPEPFAAGSVALVYRAVLVNDDQVAIKVVRPTASRQIASASGAIRVLTTAAQRLLGQSGLPLTEAVSDVTHAMARQCDLVYEHDMNERLRAIFRHDGRVRLPRVYPELSTYSILTMEFLPELVKITAFSDPTMREAGLRTGFFALFKMILEHGVIHCDFHPGNVFITPTGSLVILDTGFMEQMTPVETYQFSEFFIGIYRGDGARCAQSIVASAAAIEPRFCRTEFDRLIEELVRTHSRVAAGRFNVCRFVKRLFQIQLGCGLRGSHRFTMAILALLIYEGLAAKFVPDLDFQGEAREVIGPILLHRAF